MGDLENELEAIQKVTDKKYRQVFSQLHKLNISCNLFEKHDQKEIYECRIISVDRKFRGLGIATELARLSEMVARSTGIKIMKTELTSAYTQKIFTKLGHQVVLERRYEEMKNDEGETIIPPVPPHDSIQISIKQLH